MQQRIEREVTKVAHEHLLVFADAAETALTWLWVLRLPGQPAVTRFHTWHKGTNAEALRQRLDNIVWSLEQEEAITLTDVVDGLRRAFDSDRVTKRFYDHFKKEHQAFSGFITGLAEVSDKAWYASLMLNRLMFVYFIQKKGFLDGNPDYLADRLRAVQAQSGSGHFHSFYRIFLRRLFHEGLGLPKEQRKPDLESLIGDVPYLNGGLFALHELEDKYPDIEIDDAAFERLFAFFDAYQWHLDDRPLKDSNEINPDVLGYIFEKYINQKQMGAYYTKEDITGYISQNTVIPFLLDQARGRCKVAFDGEASVWAKLAERPDAYLYEAVRTGVIDANGDTVPESALPGFVQTGMEDPKARMFDRNYNLGEAVFHTATGERGTLPTETWREYVDRRRRCLDLRERMTRGEMHSVEDLITYNLDIRQFMQDVIQDCDSPALLRAIWQAIVGRAPGASNQRVRHGITVLDPTCGSGAFLFAALNVLEPLYEACLDRMQGFIDDADRVADGGTGRTGAKQYPDFRAVLDEVGRHPSSSYFIYKSIILHNLYGVDIMPEAVEICKLRLFLKLVSQVERGQELEPLPDMDFNIRAGNTLVGFATEREFDRAKNLASDVARHDAIKLDLADLAEDFDTFRKVQTAHGGRVSASDKARLRDKLGSIAGQLDQFLAREYGIDPDKPAEFDPWRASHQPFHWFAEFYGVMRAGGFDVVIGNPPYLEYSKVKNDIYSVLDYRTRSCNNLYALTVERSFRIVNDAGATAMIVPISLACAGAFEPLREILLERERPLWLSHFSNRPGQLFVGAQNRLTIYVAKMAARRSDIFSTSFIRWDLRNGGRDALFALLNFCKTDKSLALRKGILPKVGAPEAASVLRKIKGRQTIASEASKTGRYPVYWIRVPGYFCQFFREPPMVQPADGGAPRPRGELNAVTFDDADGAAIAHCMLNSSSYYLFFCVYTDTRHINAGDVRDFPFRGKSYGAKNLAALARLSSRLSQEFEANTSKWKKSGLLIDSTNSAACKSTLDEIDRLVASYYGFSDEELDFVINNDIKYRMSSLAESEE